MIRTRLDLLAIALLAGAATFAPATPATAQDMDSLTCYRGYALEPTRSEGEVDITPLRDSLFPVETGCNAKLAGTGKHRRRRRDVCAPTATTVVEAEPPASPIAGPEIDNDLICYTVKCPGGDIADLEVEDMFGRRTIEFSSTRNRGLCVPALRGEPPATTTTTTLPGGPRVYDHLECFVVNDLPDFQATLDLTVAGPAELPMESGCKLQPYARHYCTPASSEVRSFGGTLVPVGGAELTSDYLCYWLRCAKNEIGDFETTDRFGTKTFKRFRAREICVPVSPS